MANTAPRRLAELEQSRCARVCGIDADFALRERLAALGLRPGRTIEVVRRRGVDGPMQVRIGHTDLVLRLEEARRIAIEVPS